MKYNSVYYNYASKKLSRMKLQKQDEEFGISVNWCRYLEDGTLQKFNEPNEHKHTCYELLFMLNGCDTYIFEDETKIVTSSGEFLLISKNVKHAAIERESCCFRFAVSFDVEKSSGEQAYAIVNALSHAPYSTGKLTTDMLWLIERILGESHDMHALSRQIIMHSLVMLIVDVTRQISSSYADFKNVRYDNYDNKDQRLEVMQKYINDNISRMTTVEDLVSYMYMSPKQLNRLVKKEIDMNTKQFIDYVRCKKARKLLLETDMYIYDISDALGFSDVNNFNRFFKRIEGMAPGVFRASKGK